MLFLVYESIIDDLNKIKRVVSKFLKPQLSSWGDCNSIPKLGFSPDLK